MVADLSLAPTVGPLGTPVVDFLAATDDTSAGKPWPPIMVRPRYEEEVFINASGRIKVHGVGGIAGAWIHLTVVGGGADMVVPIGSEGQWFAEVPIATGRSSCSWCSRPTRVRAAWRRRSAPRAIRCSGR